MVKCFFCTTVKEKKGIEFFTKSFFCRFDDNPIAPGHLLIVPKKHILSLLDVSTADWQDLRVVIHKAVALIKKTNKKSLYSHRLQATTDRKEHRRLEIILKSVGINRKPDGYNFGVNDGASAGRTVHHLHVHIIPRYKGDVKDPRGGIRHLFPKLGHY